MTTPRLLTPEQAATPAYLNLPLDQVYRLVREGEIRALRIGRKVLIPVKAVELFAERAFSEDASRIASRPPRPKEQRSASPKPARRG